MLLGVERPTRSLNAVSLKASLGWSASGSIGVASAPIAAEQARRMEEKDTMLCDCARVRWLCVTAMRYNVGLLWN